MWHQVFVLNNALISSKQLQCFEIGLFGDSFLLYLKFFGNNLCFKTLNEEDIFVMFER